MEKIKFINSTSNKGIRVFKAIQFVISNVIQPQTEGPDVYTSSIRLLNPWAITLLPSHLHQGAVLTEHTTQHSKDSHGGY